MLMKTASTKGDKQLAEMDVYCKQIEYSGNDVITFSMHIIHYSSIIIY